MCRAYGHLIDASLINFTWLHSIVFDAIISVKDHRMQQYKNMTNEANKPTLIPFYISIANHIKRKDV